MSQVILRVRSRYCFRNRTKALKLGWVVGLGCANECLRSHVVSGVIRLSLGKLVLVTLLQVSGQTDEKSPLD